MTTRSITTTAILVALMTSAATAQNIKYEKYKLQNGMTVILHEDHSVPSACINTWYHVGSKDEEFGRSGFAHLFEHLMFMGTHRVPGGDFDNLMEASGGFNNASTSKDRTNYYSMGPAELLPTLLWLDADRLEGLGKAMTTEKLNKQRDVVRNERRQTSENRPYGRADLKVTSMMFPDGHPYHHTVIGSHEDLEAGTLDDVKNFFAKYYVPSNASLVVAGDFNPDEIKPLIENIFGTLPRGSDVVHAKKTPVKLHEVKRLTMTDAVQFARTTMVYHSPAHYAKGDAEMDLAAAVLSEGISSRLYQRLIYKDKIAVDVSAYQGSSYLGSLFYIQATAKPGVELEKIENTIDEVVAEFLASGPTEEELNRQKTQIEFSMLNRLQSILAKADRMNAYEFFYGEPNSFKRDLDRYRNASPSDVLNVSKNVFTQDARLILRVIPEIKKPEINARDTKPDIAASPPFAPLLPETFTLSNGITVHHWQRSELPLISMTMLFPGGATNDPPDQAGLASLTTNMLDEGAGDLGAIAFSDTMDELGASFRASSSREWTDANLSVLSRNFNKALSLYADALQRPRFEVKEWDRVHSLHMQRLKRMQDNPSAVARTVAMRAYFGDQHPYGRPSMGSESTIKNIHLMHAKRFHERLCRPEGAVILIAGDITRDQARKSLEQSFGSWRGATGVKPLSRKAYTSPVNDILRVVMVDRPGAVQTVIRFMMPGPVYSDSRRVPLELFNTILGGSLTSRLNQNLREEHGYTYGARCGYTMDASVGYFTASSSVRTDVTGESIREFMKEFKAIRDGDISQVEAGKARSSGRMGMIRSFAGLGGILNAASTLIRNDRPFSDLGEQLDAVAKVHENDLNRLAHEAVPVEKTLLLLVGDKSEILKQTKELGLPSPIELTATGDPVK